MKVTYSLINNGNRVKTMDRELDGHIEKHKLLIQSDKYDGMDPLELARDGKPVEWIEVISGGVAI